ncbi:MAG: helix-turn-helix domain-containing protein [Bacteroidetes bacterium]|jgi:AraC-like DNA-binding protein|nr:helix-turn-helix domain-containing protein [Bacteroidota bacterium]
MFELNIFQILLLIGLGNALILLVSFTQIRRKYRKPALYLGLFIVGYLAYQANFTVIPVIQSKLSFVIPNLPTLLFLPALFLYFVESTFDPDFRIEGRYKFFLIPGFFDVIQQILSWLYVLNHPAGPIHDFLTGRGKHFTMEGLGIVFSLLCFFYAIRKLIRTRTKKKKTDAYTFYKFVLAGLAIILGRWIATYFIDLFAPGSYHFNWQYYFWLFDTGFLLYTGYKILVSPKVLKSDSGGFSLPENNHPSVMSNRLEKALKEKKLFLKPTLTRADLAEELGVSEVYISSLLNEEMRASFYELINRYRFEEALRLIQAGKLNQITVEALAKEAGFKSKSTFNKVFKKQTGTTPTRYVIQK